MVRKVLMILGGFILLVVLASGAGYYYLVRLPLPLTDGELHIKGLRAPVRVFRDHWGVPHIYAANEHDLFLAQGFVQAQDRLWQMELNRRLAAGRLSEIIGPEALDLDRLVRTLGLMRAARKELAFCSGSTLKVLQAFSQGVNAFIASHENRLPLEFRLLGFRPGPWRPEDSLAWGKVMDLLGGKNWQEELVRALMAHELGEEKTKDLLGLNRPGTPSILPPDLHLSLPGTTSSYPLQDFLPGLGGASNNWVVAGMRTATGLPLLANDMHLANTVPSIWYEMHLVGGNFDVIGLSLPGVPLIIAGHNEDIAWGITFAYTDVQDLFLERLNPDQPGRYLYKGEWVKADLIKESIRIKGLDSPVVHEVWETRHGPIISTQVPGAQGLGYAMALQWTAHEPGGMATTLYRMNQARNWTEFKMAAQRWSEPAVNLVYADREGNIGYVLGSRIPIRSQGHGRGPFAGWTGDNEWVGYLSPDQKPSLLNPHRGFMVTANNRVTGPDYPYYLSDDYSSGFRAMRIEEFLEGKNKLSKDDFRTLQGDLKCLPAKQFVDALKGMEFKDPDSQNLLNMLRSWDQVLNPESAGGAIYAVLYYRLMENTFRDEMGPLADRFFGRGFLPLDPLNRFAEHSRSILLRLMSDQESPWFDDIRTPEHENLRQVLEKSLKETAAYLRETLGPDPSAWRWGRLHRVYMQHALGRVRPLDWVFNLGPFEVGGHFTTVWQSAVRPGMDFSLKDWSASNRHIYDLKDWDQSVGAIVPGQSGMIGSRHYKDQLKLWLTVGHHPLYFSKAKVESEAKHVLTLLPKY